MQIEISECWNINTKVVLIVISTLGTVGKNLGLKLSTLFDSPRTKKPKKTALMKTSVHFKKSFGLK